jgi:hypothetical protein
MIFFGLLLAFQGLVDFCFVDSFLKRLTYFYLTFSLVLGLSGFGHAATHVTFLFQVGVWGAFFIEDCITTPHRKHCRLPLIFNCDCEQILAQTSSS